MLKILKKLRTAAVSTRNLLVPYKKKVYYIIGKMKEVIVATRPVAK